MLATLTSRFSASIAFVIEAGLATIVGPAVAVAVVPKLARLVTLAGLVSDLSSNCMGLGMEIALATVDIPSLIVVASGASWGLLIPPCAMKEITLCPGFSLIAPCWLLCASSRFLRSSANAAAPVNVIGEKAGENAPLKRGDFGDGDATSPELVIVLDAERFCDCSDRFRFKDFVRVVSGSAWAMVVGGMGADSDKFAL